MGEDRPTAATLGDALRELDVTLSIAESCTGGLLAAAVTEVPGASDYFEAGMVTYAYGAKRRLLGVSREALDEHGAVSEPVARAMARAVRDTADVDWGVATTGVAGPTGGDEETPVGTAYVGVAHAAPWGTEASFVRSERVVVDGDRGDVKRGAADAALGALLRAVREVDGGTSPGGSAGSPPSE
jgi:nicotinamide-nucleotide amidase